MKVKKYNQINIEHILFALYYFFALCPFVSPLRLASDLQPFALIASLIVIVYLRNIRITKELYIILCVLGFATVLLFVAFIQDGSQFFLCVRKYVNYLSVFVIPLAGFNIYVRQGHVNESWIKRLILLWLIVGCIELIYPPFSQMILPGSRTTAGRGVVGLAMEPSFYGYTMFFFLILASIFKKNSFAYQLICAFQIVFLAKSSIAIVFLALYLLLWGMEKCQKMYRLSLQKFVKLSLGIIMTICSITILCQVLVKTMPDSRMVVLAKKMIFNMESLSNLDELYQLDASVAERVDSIAFALTGFAKNIGLPNGFIYADGRRIMSGYGTPLYELGIVGVVLIVALIVICMKGFFPHWSKAIAITATMFAAIQLSSPTFSFLISVALYKCRRKNDEKK